MTTKTMHKNLPAWETWFRKGRGVGCSTCQLPSRVFYFDEGATL